MSTLKNFVHRNRKAAQTLDKIKMRSHLNADTLFALFERICNGRPTTELPMHRSRWTTP